MAQGNQQLKFKKNPCMEIKDNCDTNDRRTTDYLPSPIPNQGMEERET